MGLKAVEPSTYILQNEELGFDKDRLALLIYSNPTVSNLALSYFTQMGFKNIYLFGVDLGFSGDAHHSKKSIYYDKAGDDKLLFDKKALSAFVAPGNHVEEVETTMIFQMSAKGLGELLTFYPDVNCYNLGNGIKIDNTIPAYPVDINLPDVSVDKVELVDRMLTHYASDTRDLAVQYSAVLAQQVFPDFVDEMIALVKPAVGSRYDALQQLHQQFILLHSKYDTKHSFLVEMLRGTMQHCHAMIIKVLLLPAESEQGLIGYQQAIDIFITYLEAAKDKYQRELLKKDNTQLPENWT